MSKYARGQRLISTLLLILIIVVAIAMWTLDLIAQQRTFAFLLSAELVALAMLVYLYYEETPEELSKRWLFAGSSALAILILLSVVVFPGVFTTSPTPSISITLYEGEASPTVYGFGYASDNLTSPGPTLTFNVSEVVKVTVVNVGQQPHNWAIVSANQTSAPILFHAQIQSPSNPLQPGQSGSVVFTATQAGNFFYVCQVPGHVDLGMWGEVVVNR